MKIGYFDGSSDKIPDENMLIWWKFMIILESFFNIMKIQDIDVVLAARTALEVSMLVCFYVRNEFHPSAIYVCP